MKQSAVSWLIQNIVEDQTIKAKPMSEWLEIFEQAKSMEKKQIVEAVDDPKYVDKDMGPSSIPGISSHGMGWFINGEQYYKQTYGGDK
jgi:hypothetical protein